MLLAPADPPRAFLKRPSDSFDAFSISAHLRSALSKPLGERPAETPAAKFPTHRQLPKSISRVRASVLITSSRLTLLSASTLLGTINHFEAVRLRLYLARQPSTRLLFS